jgi:hypothetical protein
MMRSKRTATFATTAVIALMGGGGVAWACVGPGMGGGTGTTTSGSTGATGATGTTGTTTTTTTTTSASNAVRHTSHARRHAHRVAGRRA